MQIRALARGDLGGAVDLDERGGWHGAIDNEPGAFATMVERARAARARGDGLWIPAGGHFLPLEEDIARSEGWWVAVDNDGRLVGMVGMQQPNQAGSLPTELADGLGWLADDDVIELVRLRVDRKWWRSGVGTALCEIALAWARDEGYGRVVLNTSATQAPALALYRKLGFAIVATSYVGEYELLWHERVL